jgi:hypothetical protein
MRWISTRLELEMYRLGHGIEGRTFLVESCRSGAWNDAKHTTSWPMMLELELCLLTCEKRVPSSKTLILTGHRFLRSHKNTSDKSDNPKGFSFCFSLVGCDLRNLPDVQVTRIRPA